MVSRMGEDLIETDIPNFSKVEHSHSKKIDLVYKLKGDILSCQNCKYSDPTWGTKPGNIAVLNMQICMNLK